MKRILTAVLAGSLFLVVAWIGGYPFIGMTLLMATIGYWEFLRMKEITPVSFPEVLGFLIVIWWTRPNQSDLNPSALLLAVMLLLLWETVRSKNRFHYDKAAFVVFAALYVSFGFHYMIVARLDPGGRGLLFFILLVTWSRDSGAHAVRVVAPGKHKLCPEISPRKTVRGSVGGILLALAVAGLFQLLFSPFSNSRTALLVGFIISIVGQIGDLVESALKRHYGVKDSGRILPGHGGILDRCDSWLFVFPVLHLLHFI